MPCKELKLKRAQVGISQMRLAQETGIPRSRISNYENNYIDALTKKEYALIDKALKKI